MLVFRDLYSYYSRLKLDNQRDRPLAIAVLEKRLIQGLGLRGGYGIVDDGLFDASGPGLLRRSLLWCRGSDEASLRRIDFQDDGHWHDSDKEAPPPSWSWMAYEGGIDYLDLSFEPILWASRDIESPWSGAATGTWDGMGDSGSGRTELKVVVRSIKLEKWLDAHSYVKFDNPTKASKSGIGLACVVLGRLRTRGTVQSRTHCVMLVIPTSSVLKRGREPCYERVGVGYLCSDLIDLEELGVLASIH